MPRKAFVADLQEAIRHFRHDRILDLGFGTEDGSITFRYVTTDTTVAEATVQALVPDVGDYPTSHTYMVYTTSENVPPSVNSALEAASSFDGLSVTAMLTQIANLLDQATAGFRQNPVDIDADLMDVDNFDPEAGLDEDDSDAGFDGGWSPESTSHQPSDMESDTGSYATTQPATAREISRRIRGDLRQAKQADFRVSHLRGLTDNEKGCIVMLSCRIYKLGISEEAMQAWHLQPNQYFVLIIRYMNGYRNLDQLMEFPNSSAKTIETRVALCSRYKLSKDEVLSVFATSKTKDQQKYRSDVPHEKAASQEKGLYPLFIARPLDELMNGRLVALIRYRMTMGLSWARAEDFYTDHQGMNFNQSDSINEKYWREPMAQNVATLPRLTTADHLQKSIQKNLSFPLVAMQFALRHLVRCTEFCLVCHCRVETDFEALKPYVCSKPLCLYQYMALGFGPSIEHEIVSQPHVVDLLISFCYTSAFCLKLKSLPDGMNLCVPFPKQALWQYDTAERLNAPLPIPKNAGKYSGAKESSCKDTIDAHNKSKGRARFDQEHLELILQPQERKLFPGNWITFTVGHRVTYHCRVNEVLLPTVKLGSPVICALPDAIEKESTVNHGLSVHMASSSVSNPQSASTPATRSSAVSMKTPKYPEVEYVVYDQNFDDLTHSEKQHSVCLLLETLPRVTEMKDYLQSETGKAQSLHTWSDRISPAALGVLRWIIASNRSCIVQVDRVEGGSHAPEERVSGMPGWMQFRFAQGAPDKEQRFIQSVQKVTEGSKYPTLFAWHGSPLFNWHSIVREGLHFQHTAHGRSYGNGVYHATDVQTSLSYTLAGQASSKGSQSSFYFWPQSQLKISQAIALNEIVNAPKQFISSAPHLVVAQLDWIQTRYLFVKPHGIDTKISDERPFETYEQDPAYTPKGSGDRKIAIPITAVRKSRRPLSKILQNGKKVKVSHNPNSEGAAVLSDVTDIEDLEIFGSDEDIDLGEDINLKSGCRLDYSKTNFIPGSLDHNTVPLLQPPTYATPFASKALQRELKATLKAQETHPAHELGWYINPEHVTNVYQWIVELHSFEKDLPLAHDMKSKNLQSIVMEMRFGKDYPMSPPFIRIVRPRFVSFMHGGGGHVTAGGALCMELLTNSGWSAVSNIESVLLQVRLAISSTEPRPARLQPGPVKEYAVGEAIDAYIRACHTHGWEVPEDFRSSHSA